MLIKLIPAACQQKRGIKSSFGTQWKRIYPLKSTLMLAFGRCNPDLDLKMEELARLNEATVHQEDRYGSQVAGHLSRVAYMVRAPGGKILYRVAEAGGSLASRFLPASHRPMWLEVRRTDESVVLRLKRVYFIFYPCLKVELPGGRLCGSVRKRFILMHDAYEIRDGLGRKLFSILRKRWEPWIFHVRRDGIEMARIEKVLLDLLRDISTTFDDYRISFPSEADPLSKSLLLCTTFLVDLAHFE
jgi:hypothetical protein